MCTLCSSVFVVSAIGYISLSRRKIFLQLAEEPWHALIPNCLAVHQASVKQVVVRYFDTEIVASISGYEWCGYHFAGCRFEFSPRMLLFLIALRYIKHQLSRWWHRRCFILFIVANTIGYDSYDERYGNHFAGCQFEFSPGIWEEIC